ncbi:hypothetical protein SUGI_0262250 [Cryptomeria japonica]|nr:hypothetical protein SUGI_0262250 [Cryptomeria japonica]
MGGSAPGFAASASAAGLPVHQLTYISLKVAGPDDTFASLALRGACFASDYYVIYKAEVSTVDSTVVDSAVGSTKGNFGDAVVVDAIYFNLVAEVDPGPATVDPVVDPEAVDSSYFDPVAYR